MYLREQMDNDHDRRKNAFHELSGWTHVQGPLVGQDSSGIQGQFLPSSREFRSLLQNKKALLEKSLFLGEDGHIISASALPDTSRKRLCINIVYKHKTLC